MAFKIAEAYVQVTTRDDTAAGEAKIKARLNRIRGTAKVDVDVDNSALRRAEQSFASFGNAGDRHGRRVLAIFALITAAAPAVAGAIAAIPAAMASLGGIGGVLLGSFHGISDALKGYAEDQQNANKASAQTAKTEQSNARQIRDAQQSIEDARRRQARTAEDVAQRIADAQREEARVTRDTTESIAQARENEARVAKEGADQLEAASRRVSDALKQESDAQKALTQAQKDAQRQIESLTERVHDLALDQEGAAISVAEAQLRYDAIMADATTTDLDRRKAAYDLATAQERVRDLTKEQTEANADLNDANAKGVNGSDQVVAAQERLNSAHQDVIDAQKELSKTQADVAQSMQDAAKETAKAVRDGAEAQQDAARRTAEAIKDGADSQADAARAVAEAQQHLADVQAEQAAAADEAAAKTSKFAEAMAKLNPQQRELVQQLLRMKPLLSDLGDAGARGFLPGMIQMLRDSEGLFPILETHLERTGTIMGDSARKMGDLFKSEEFQRNLEQLFRNSEPITRALGDGFVRLTDYLVGAGAKLGPVAQGFADLFTSFIDGIGKFFQAMEPHAEDFKVFLQAVGQLWEELLPVLGDVAGDIAHVLGPLLRDLAGWLHDNHDEAKTIIEIFGAMYLTFKAVGVVKDVSTWVQGVMGWLQKMGLEVDTQKGKSEGLAKSLKGIGVLIGAGIVGAGLKAVGKPGEGDMGSASFGDKARDAADTAGDVLTLNIGGIFDKLKRDINSLPTDIDNAGKKIDGAMNYIFGDGLTGAADSFSHWLDGMVGINDTSNQNILDSSTSHMGRMADVTGTQSQSAWDQFKSWIGRLPGDAQGWFSDMGTRANNSLSSFRDTAGQRVNETWNNFTNWIGRLPMDVGNWLSDMYNRGTQKLTDLRNTLGDLAGQLWQRIKDAFNNMANDAQAAWDRLRDIANAPIRWVIDIVYNKGIVPLWNKVVDIFGGPRAVPFAGGGVLPGYAPGQDTVPALLSPGEAVLTPEAVRVVGAKNILALNRRASGRPPGASGRYAGGGIIGTIGDWITDPVGHIKSLFSGLIADGAKTPGVGLLRDTMASLPGKVLDLAINKVKDLVKTVGSFFSAAFTGSPNLQAWIMEAIKLTGVGNDWAGPLSVLIMRESGGNPNAINNWDSNAAAGHPSQGLMQTIPSTFNAYHQPGTSWNINDPIANIAAGINYIKARYGSIFNVQQANPNLPPRGYDLGGMLPPGAGWVANYTGQPERVLSASQTEAFERFVDIIHHWYRWQRWQPFPAKGVTTQARGAGGGPAGQYTDQYGNLNTGNVTVNVVQQSGSPAETGRFVALALRGVG